MVTHSFVPQQEESSNRRTYLEQVYTKIKREQSEKKINVKTN